MWEWIADVFLAYWPALFMIVGIVFLIISILDDEIGGGIFSLIFCSSIGVVLFIWPPVVIWDWFINLEVIIYLLEGEWYIVALKIGSAIGAIGIALAIIGGILRRIFSWFD